MGALTANSVKSPYRNPPLNTFSSAYRSLNGRIGTLLRNPAVLRKQFDDTLYIRIFKDPYRSRSSEPFKFKQPFVGFALRSPLKKPLGDPW